jgi:hypothetical protein
MSDSVTDLSPYELARLERIRANEAEMVRLGLAVARPSLDSLLQQRQAAQVKATQAKAKRKRKAEAPPASGERQSKRLRHQEADEPEADEPEPEPKIDYAREWPLDADELDDHEYLIFIKLRKWRVVRKRELQIEAYKISQNRTLCELVRRRRNEEAFASGADPEQDLLACWGIGPSKATVGGFGREMLEQLADPDAAALFAKSRAMVEPAGQTGAAAPARAPQAKPEPAVTPAAGLPEQTPQKGQDAGA